jgi:hypothetical protein
MGLAPWGALGGGTFKSEEQRQAQAKEGRQVPAADRQIQVSKVLESIAKRKNTLITSVALAYVMHKTPYVFPIVGGRKIEHLKGNIEALSLELSDDDLKEIEGAYPFEIGFPHDFIWGTNGIVHTQQVNLLRLAGTFDYVPEEQVSNISGIRSNFVMEADFCRL